MLIIWSLLFFVVCWFNLERIGFNSFLWLNIVYLFFFNFFLLVNSLVIDSIFWLVFFIKDFVSFLFKVVLRLINL